MPTSPTPKPSSVVTQALTLLLAAWILTGPMNLFYKILPNYGFVGGLQVDYLIPKIYLVDIVGLCVVAVGFFQFFQRKKCKTPTKSLLLLSSFIVLFVLRQLSTPFPLSGLWFVASVLLHVAVPYIFYRNWVAFGAQAKQQWIEVMVGAVIATVLFQSLLGLYQFTYQKELIGYQFFGEPELTRGVSLSRADFAFMDDVIGTSFGFRILPYGTTAHSNILAGIVASSVFILLALWESLVDKNSIQKRVLYAVFFVVSFVLIFVSLSLSAVLTGVIGVTLIWLSPWIRVHLQSWKVQASVLVLILFSSWLLAAGLPQLQRLQDFSAHASITRRIRLGQAGWYMFTQHPVSGIGVNQFTAEVERYSKVRETVRFVQPAHHVGILFLAENGLFGILLLSVFVLWKILTRGAQKYLLLSLLLLPLFSLDHYLYTLTQGQWLVGMLWLTLSMREQG